VRREKSGVYREEEEGEGRSEVRSEASG